MALRKASLKGDAKAGAFLSSQAWLESPAFESFLRNSLRRIFGRTRVRSALLYQEATRREIKVGNRQRIQHLCAQCGEWYFRDQIQIDHIEPCEPTDGRIMTWDEFIKRLFTTKLQILCKKCHSAKSALENKTRRAAKAGRKAARVAYK